jgi:hypothetical protein
MGDPLDAMVAVLFSHQDFFAPNIHLKGTTENPGRAYGRTGLAENAFGGEDPLPFIYVLHDIDVHGTCLDTCAALCAFLAIPSDLQQSKSGCGL